MNAPRRRRRERATIREFDGRPLVRLRSGHVVDVGTGEVLSSVLADVMRNAGRTIVELELQLSLEEAA